MERFENSEQQFESEIMSTQNLFTFPEAQPSEKVLNIREPPSIVDGEERYESSGKPMAGWIQPDAAFWPSAPSCSEGGLVTHPPSNSQEINNVAVNLNLVPVSKLPPRYQPVFSQFPYFNVVQSRVFKDVFGTDSSLVVSAPTGSGKTVIMELAIIRLLMNQSDWLSSTKIIYMAPLKSIVAERFLDWKVRLGTLGVTCSEVTGDTEHDDLAVLGSSQVILTTPEKWDSLTRRWKDHANLMASISLFLIDEVHMLSDETRGPTLEAVVSRMKTLHTTRSWTAPIVVKPPRFIAISATIPNVEDVGAWLSNSDGPAITHKLEESLRPVQLKRVVLGFYCPDAWTDFRFDMMLSYKLPSVVATYCENKPTLVFVSTRKGAQQTATILIREARFIRNAEHKHFLTLEANGLRDNKLRDCVLYGVGFHHAGVDMEDRQTIERLFLDGSLSVLVSTSTLATQLIGSVVAKACRGTEFRPFWPVLIPSVDLGPCGDCRDRTDRVHHHYECMEGKEVSLEET
ncbi:putative ATP-dependent DNA helicase HFM1 isoform X2 [Oratosquilla oratoria]|uniref:putative ATP-dependent DNA helicase HFM1 isoform X2 n=1 Tax=Oratosquilla oratoria TaxID=337810 RepID=UPI003F769ADD